MGPGAGARPPVRRGALLHAQSPCGGGGGGVTAPCPTPAPERGRSQGRTPPRHTACGRARRPGLWSHRIFQRYAASLPTSLSCISSVDQRRLAEETGCGDSVRQQESGTAAAAGRSLEPMGAAVRAAPLRRTEERKDRRQRKGVEIGGQDSHRRRRCGAALPSGGLCLHLACQSIARVLLRQKEKTTPRGTHRPPPRIARRRGASPPSNGVPTRCGGMLGAPACSPTPPAPTERGAAPPSPREGGGQRRTRAPGRVVALVTR